MPYSFASLAPEYAKTWLAMTINPDRVAEFSALGKKLLARIPKYQAVSQATGVPTSVIAVIHEREASGDFNTYLGNGDRLDRMTVDVPVGRGPFASWDAGAIDALRYDGLDKITDWSIERAAFVLEGYNGFGYRQYHNMPSPYLWGGTNQQHPGKYVADGKFDPSVMDSQPGCMPLLYVLWSLDRTLALHLSTDVSSPAPQPIPAPTPPDVPLPRPRPPVPPQMPSQVPTGLVALIIGLAAAGFLWASQVLHAALQFLHLN